MLTQPIPADKDTPSVPPDASARFVQQVAIALTDGSFVKLVLGKPQHEQENAQLERVTARTVMIRGEPHISLLWHYQTRDITKNLRFDELLELLPAWLGQRFLQAHLQTHSEELQLAYSRKGRPSLRVGKLAAPGIPTANGHDRAKQRPCELDRPFWDDLGLTHTVKGVRTLVPAMSRKWKQINHFLEVFDAALKSSRLAESPTVQVADFGSGKGYLTFAMYDWLHTQGKNPSVTGVELRDDLVKLCSTAAARNNLAGLHFTHGDVRSYTPARVDVMIALHACDIATDYAIHLGLRAGAAIIMCSPCCHKQLRPQMASPAVLRPLLRHGIHLGQEAEMVTDGLRALLLEAEGYETQVFEFVSLEHTSKNKMILAVKRAHAPSATRRAELLEQVADIKRFYGVHEQALEALLCPA